MSQQNLDGKVLSMLFLPVFVIDVKIGLYSVS